MKSMLQLFGYIQRMSSRRDRTEITAELLDAIDDLFHPLRLTIYRCYANDQQVVIFDCAGIGEAGRYCRNAYLPSPGYCTPVDRDPLLLRCQSTLSLELEACGAHTQRLIFPVAHDKRLYYLVDAILPESFPAEERVALMSLTEFFGKHIALLDYGETDTLTGLANRKTFDKHLFEVLGNAMADIASAGADMPQRRQAPATDTLHWLAVCDIDHFKSINDTYGHLMGDEVLVMLAQLMRRSFRLSDQLFRFGGEEFVVVLQPTTRDGIVGVFERFRHTIDSFPFSRVGHTTISIGVTRLLGGDTPTDVIDRADEALYYAKSHGRNQVALYEQLIEEGKLASKAVSHGDIELF